MVMFSVERAYPRAKELFGQIPSSHGEFTLQSETCPLRQQSRSMPSRLVSTVSPWIWKLSTPVASRPKGPPLRMAKSFSKTFRQFLRAIALLPTRALPRGACHARRGSARVGNKEIGRAHV